MTLSDSIEYWIGKLESLDPFERAYFYVVIFLALLVPFIEYSAIANVNQKIGNYENQIENMSTIIDYGMYLDTLTEVDKMVSYSLSIQQGETSFGNMSDETKVLHTRVETRYFDMCRNLNRASQYTNVTINCLKLSTVERARDMTEFNKFNQTRITLYTTRGDLKTKVLELKSEKEDITTLRNVVYVLLVFLSGLGSVFAYANDKTNSKK